MFRPFGLMHIIAINSDQFCSHYFLYHVEVKKIRESLFTLKFNIEKENNMNRLTNSVLNIFFFNI